MKKNILKQVGTLLAVGVILTGSVACASQVDYGAKGAEDRTTYSLEEMLKYAIEDEYLARAEYDLIIDEFGADRPFTNIIKAEEKHIEELEELYETYELDIPSVDPSEHLVVPATIDAAFEAGVQAEIENIAMYEKFLATELPDDVRDVFEELKKGSESHLKAFSRNASDEKGNSGAGRNDKSNQSGKGNADRNDRNNQSGNGSRSGNDGGNGIENKSGYGNRNSESRNYQNQKLEHDEDCEVVS